MPSTPAIHTGHTNRARTYLAALCGTVALFLIMASVMAVWLNRTLTDTDTYAKTVAPLAADPDIQDFFATKATDTLLQNAPPEEVAKAVLTPAEIAGKTPDQLQAESRLKVHNAVRNIINDENFQSLWLSNNLSIHSQLVSQLQSETDELKLDFSPLVRGVVKQIENSELAPVSQKLILPDDVGQVSLKGGPVDSVRQYYDMLKAATIIIVILTVAAVVGCVVLSIHHWRTVRRILVGSGLLTLGLAAALQAPTLLMGAGRTPEQSAALAIAGTLFHDLQFFLVVFGISCIVVAIGSKVYAVLRKQA